MIQYEEKLRDLRWGLSEASEYFEGRGVLRQSLDRITERLDQIKVPYAVCGGLALYAHGFARFTDDVDLLVTPKGLKRIHEELEGLGYLPPFAGSKNLRDSQTQVRIEFLVTGQFPGDGKPKEISFPDPSDVAMEIRGIKYLSLKSLIELKLASGMSNTGRLKDLADVQELIKAINIPVAFSEQLAASVRGKFNELFGAIQPNRNED